MKKPITELTPEQLRKIAALREKSRRPAQKRPASRDRRKLDAAFDEAMRRHDELNEAMRRDSAGSER